MSVQHSEFCADLVAQRVPWVPGVSTTYTQTAKELITMAISNDYVEHDTYWWGEEWQARHPDAPLAKPATATIEPTDSIATDGTAA